MEPPNINVKSLAKAMRVLECFMGRGELGVTEISESLGLYKSNVCDILTTFEAMGYVDQSGRTGKYRLGDRVLELSHALTSSTLADPALLKEDLRTTRARGYAIDNMEHEHGIRCVGVPIMGSMGNVVAGMSVSCPSPRLDDEKLVVYARRLQEIAKIVGIYF